MSDIQMYEVGGAVRDDLLRLPIKDIDFAVEADSFDVMRQYLIDQGFEIFVESPQYLTLRARFPSSFNTFGGRSVKGLTADFVLARSEGEYLDGRRPSSVSAGSLLSDLSRRDFTMNAIAKASDGTIIDPFGGVNDIHLRLIRAVGNVEDRFREDSLRALRALRFCITKNLFLHRDVTVAIQSDWLPPLLASVSTERKREELYKAFKADTIRTLHLLSQLSNDFIEAVFVDGLWLMPTLRS